MILQERKTQEKERMTIKEKRPIPQAGGHQGRVLIDSTDPQRIIKKTKRNELKFYRSLVNQLERPLLPSDSDVWSDWRAKFFGPWNHKTEAEEVFITLENLTFRRSNLRTGQGDQEQLFNHPNVLDIKLGQKLHDDQATQEKKQRMSRVALETTTAEFGMRLTGAQLWDNVRGEYSGIPKSFGKTIDRTGTDLQIKFNTFFPISDPRLSRVSQEGLTFSSGGLPSGLLKQIIDRSIIPKIQRILTYLSAFNWRIYGASLLIIFEADFVTLDSILSSSHSSDHHVDQLFQDIASVKIIDFAHVQLADSPDPGLLKGLQSTLNLFYQLSLQLDSHLT
ncbi:hypothetical protein H4Q26_003964 [Puccinia striiformis f. sp. tritici PST-130]|uniref:Kinase n=2 Tax=Puccinia striiformis f. sp. tritici TaxID=168172 RepID=A0A0L0VAA3_9BASI|nr:hypothetical protein H4Q26_003964 [Puccinia striiformis f. sp. tritici PST-130]KNE96136.1 hypothetical protein PSTG_10556 [Puccinia striiformis f. sp. tritici PST-78]